LLVVVEQDIMVAEEVPEDFFGMDHQLHQKQQMVLPLHIITAQHIQYLLALVVLLLDLILSLRNEVIVELPQL
jgi:hypothetical protein